MGSDYTVRMPDLTMATNMRDNVVRTRDLYEHQMELISSGKRFAKRSEAPTQRDEISKIKNKLSANDRWRKNVEMAQGWESATEARLFSMMEISQRLRELEVQCNNGTNSAADRKSIGEEVNGLIESLLTEANSTYIGTPLFGGTDTDTVPYSATRDADGNITAITYNGGTSRREIQTAEGTTSQYGLVGQGAEGIFQFESIEGDPPVTNTVNVFDNLIAFRDSLNNGDVPSDTILGRVTKMVDHMANKVIENAVSQQKLNRLEANINVFEQSSNDRLSDIEDLDVAAAISQLNQLEASLQASMQLIGRMNSMSILNFF